MIKLKAIFKQFWPFLLLGLLSFGLPLIWLRDGLPISYAEPGFLYFLTSPIVELKMYIYAWWDKLGLGVVSSSPARSLYFVFSCFLSWLGLSELVRQYIIFSLLLLSAGLATYFLALEIFKNKLKKLSCLVSLFYLFNTFILNYFWHRFSCVIFGLPFLPLFMLAAIKLRKSPQLKWSLFLGLITIFASLPAAHMGYFIPLVLPAILYVILFFRKKSQWRYLGLGLLISLGLSIWWLLPFLINMTGQLSSAGDSLSTFLTTSQWAPLWSVWRQLNLAAFFWYNVDYFPGLIEFLIPILALVGLLSKKKIRYIKFFGLLLVLGLYLSKGSQPPFGGIYTWLFKRISFLAAFRNSQEKFGIIIAFAYSFLVPVGLIWLTAKLKNKILKLASRLVIVFLLLGLSIWPMWTGEVFSHWQGAIPQGAENVPGNKVAIPDYWQQAAEFINQDKDVYRILFLPQVWLDYVWYDWSHGFIGGDFTSTGLLFDQPTISGPGYLPDSYSEQARQQIITDLFENQDISRMKFLNIKYILVRNDVHPDGPAQRPLAEIYQALNSLERVKKIKTFGQVDIYQVDESEFLPRFFIEGSQSELSFKKVNPTKYKIKVKNPDKEFLLVFSETFNPGWQIKSTDQLTKAEHIRTNIYANAWRIKFNQPEIDLTVYYQPQNLVYIGLVISSLSFLAIITYLIYRKHYDKKISK